ncbi:hypothetical protein EDC01DRAFT_270421 [Geopyxis carbonaria]|nr:hypothetical protein EDC01DRAFT_270421 [Geopyxis carbonaria]
MQRTHAHEPASDKLAAPSDKSIGCAIFFFFCVPFLCTHRSTHIGRRRWSTHGIACDTCSFDVDDSCRARMHWHGRTYANRSAARRADMMTSTAPTGVLCECNFSDTEQMRSRQNMGGVTSTAGVSLKSSTAPPDSNPNGGIVADTRPVSRLLWLEATSLCFQLPRHRVSHRPSTTRLGGGAGVSRHAETSVAGVINVFVLLLMAIIQSLHRIHY